MDNDYNERPIAYKLYNKMLENVDNTANVNPFTPDSKLHCDFCIIFIILISTSFEPTGLQMKNKKRSRIVALQENNASCTQDKSIKRRSVASLFSDYYEGEEDEVEQHQAPKRLALQDTNISRYRREFVEIELIGKL